MPAVRVKLRPSSSSVWSSPSKHNRICPLEHHEDKSSTALFIHKGQIVLRILHHTHANRVKLLRTPQSITLITCMACGRYLGPVGDTERDIVYIHVVILYDLLKKAPCGAFF